MRAAAWSMSSSTVAIVFLHTSGLMTIAGISPLLVGVCIVSMSAASSLWGSALLSMSARQR